MSETKTSATATAAAEAEAPAVSGSGGAQPAAPAPKWWQEITQPFIDLFRAPRAVTGVNVSYVVEGLCYWGVLALLNKYIHETVGLNDLHTGWMVGYLTWGITLSMVFLGGLADRWGVRRAIIVAVSAMLFGRFCLAGDVLGTVTGSGTFNFLGGLLSYLGIGTAAGEHVNWSLFASCFLGLTFVVAGYGMYQPAAYLGVRQFMNEKSAPMGYAMLYALMNLGGFMPAIMSPFVRREVGITGVFWVYVALTAAGLILFAVILTKRAQANRIALVEKERAAGSAAPAAAKPEPVAAAAAAPARKDLPLFERFVAWLKNHPLADAKFSFFIFALIPVQTLFAHNWLTLNLYVDRALGKVGSDYMEFFSNLNPALIFVLTPIVASLTRNANVYRMMIAGTFVMAVPTFLLALPPNVWLLLVYLLINAVGEAMWQPRFLQYAAEIAPPGRTGAYMGVAQLPWFLTKFVTSLYSGWFLMHYVPEPSSGLQQNPGTMWFIYACIAMTSTLMLFLARGWVGKDFKTKAG